jgi:hypothetical protein
MQALYRTLYHIKPVCRTGGTLPFSLFTLQAAALAVVQHNIFDRSEACRCDAGVDGFADRFLGA